MTCERMMRYFKVNVSSCLTCEYLTINRKVEFQNQQMYIAFATVQGKCQARNNCLMGQNSGPCKNYKRWHELP